MVIQRLFALLALLVVHASAYAGPFGIEMGMRVDELTSNAKEAGPGLYQLDSVPQPHSAFESYAIKASPTHGVCWVKGIGRDISTNVYGLQLRSTFEEMHQKLVKIYGNSKVTDLLMPGSIWDEANDFMMGMLKRERYLMAQWSAEEKSTLDDEIETIGLMANALRTDTGYIALEYYFSNKDACDAEIAETEDSAL